MEWLLALGLISGGGCDDTSEIWEDTDGRGSQEYSRLFGQCLATLWHEVWPLWTDFYLFIPVCTIRSHHGVVPQTMVLSFRHGVGPALKNLENKKKHSRISRLFFYSAAKNHRQNLALSL
jgi:hypothetical protein